MKIEVKFTPRKNSNGLYFKKTFKTKAEYDAFELGKEFANTQDTEDGIWTKRTV